MKKTADETNPINEVFIHFYVTSYMKQSLKHTVSNELPFYISGRHILPVASLIPAKIHVLQTNGNTNVYSIPKYLVNGERNVGLLTVKQS